MIKRFITPALLVITVLCTHIAHAALIRVSDGKTVSVSDLTTETMPVWDIVNDKLYGAYNVNVGGTLWDVRFSTGNFGEVFTDPTVIEELSHSDANRRMGELFYTFVLPLADRFSRPYGARRMMGGCDVGGSSDVTCNILLPYEGLYEDGLYGDKYHNGSIIQWNNKYTRWEEESVWAWPADEDGFNGPSNQWFAYAIWEKKNIVKVPAPATIAIFSLGLMGLASRRFKKQS